MLSVERENPVWNFKTGLGVNAMVMIDTNFFCSFYNNFDVNHQIAKELFFDLDDDEQIKIPYVVAAEIAVSKDSIRLLNIAKQLSQRFVTNNDEDLEYISKFAQERDSSLKANDFLILALCKRYRAKLLSFDKKLVRAVLSL